MKFFQIIPSNTKINFISKFPIFIAFSVVTLIIVIGAIATKGLNYGIDFTGGTVMQVKYSTPTKIEDVRSSVMALGDLDSSVVGLGTEEREYLITARAVHLETNQTPLKQQFLEKVGADKVSVLSAEVVGPKVGAELKMAALRSLFYSVILIAIYIWLRFDFRFAPGATVAMVHDLIMCAGFYYFSGREFTITAVAALLTVAGYSVNDTIVIYDRVREMFKEGGEDLPLGETINKAVNLTLSRTLLTSLVTFVSIVPIIFLCKGEIQSFAMAMCFGIFVGAYSTIYIASPFTIYVEKFLSSREKQSARKTAKA